MSAESVVKGGWRLSRFADPEDEMGRKLREVFAQRKWDYIVLQEQSLLPASDPEAFYASAEKLHELMRGDAAFLLYQTWAYQDGSQKLTGTGMSYEEMHSGLPVLPCADRPSSVRNGLACGDGRRRG